MIAVKGNQEALHEAAKAAFAGVVEAPEVTPMPTRKALRRATGGWRRWRCWATSQVKTYGWHEDWKWLSSFVMVESERTEREKNETKVERRYFINSLPADDAARLASVVRTHWTVDNDLHWSLDVAFHEDESRVSERHAQENMSMMRRLALSLMKQDTKTKAGIVGRRKKAGWDHDYLLALLTLRS